MNTNDLNAPSAVTQNIARAKAYIKRDEPVRAIETMLDGLKLFEPKKILGKARFATEVLIEECVAELNRSPKIRTFLEAVAKSSSMKMLYKPGEEKALIQVLAVLHKALEQSELNEKMDAEAKTNARRTGLWEKGTALLADGDAAMGRAVLRRMADEFGHEDGVLANIGKKLLDAKLYFEAQEFLEQALEAFPKQSRIYTDLIACNMAMREVEKVEAIYKAAIKQFGMHPQTLLNFARFYLDWNKRDDAAEQALAVLRADPDNEEAKALYEKAEGRYNRSGR